MVVKIEQIKDVGGLTLDEPVGVELLGSALVGDGKDTGFRAVEPSRLHAFFQKVSRGVILKASFTAKLQAPCKRCLKDVEISLPVAFTLNLVPESLVRDQNPKSKGGDDEGAGMEDGSFALDNADQELFDGKKIDLDPIVREQVLLALPMDAVCSEDCKGLCPVCGQNLNEKNCSCERKVVDPRLAALKNIKLN